MSDRREFLKTSLGNGLKLAGLGSLASSAWINRMRAAPQGQDEDGYQISLRESKSPQKVGNVGRPAPAWLRNAEVYSSYVQWSEEVVETLLKGFPLIIGVPHVKKWIAEAHRYTIRVTPYISFYKSLDSKVAQKSSKLDFGAISSPFWNELDLNKHPEWMLYDKQGEARRPFSDPNYTVGWEQVCTAAPGFAQASLRGVQALLALGADGVFIDNVHPTPHCYGPVFGKHTHVNGLDNGLAFRELLATVYASVKKASPDHIVALNSGWVDPRYWPCGDAMMWESYICTTDDKLYTCSEAWDPILEKAEACKRAIQCGKAVLALSYYSGRILAFEPASLRPNFQGQPASKEEVFFSYSCARLSGFLWSDYFSLPLNHPARVLYKVRPGRALGNWEEIDGVYVRRFQRGIVAVNPTNETKPIQIPEVQAPMWQDIYTARMVEAKRGSLPIEVPAHAGRVYCSLARG